MYSKSEDVFEDVIELFHRTVLVEGAFVEDAPVCEES
jgi:hypothetical protein